MKDSEYQKELKRKIEYYRKYEKAKNEKMVITTKNLGSWLRDPSIVDVSIDRITVMGNWVYKGAKKFQRLHDSQIFYYSRVKYDEEDGRFDEISMEFIDYETIGHDREPIGMIFNKVFFQMFDQKSKPNVRQFRMEWNPNKLTDLENDFLIEKILPLLKNVSFTRVDIAFDFNESIGDLYYFEPEGKHARKETVFYSPSKAVETKYIGSRSSDNMIRIYDKKKEIEKRIRKGEHVTEEELKKFNELEKWFRLEFELKRECAIDWFDEKSTFKDLQILCPDWKSVKDPIDRIKIKALMENEISWKDIPYKEKTKLKQKFSISSPFDLMDEVHVRFKQEKKRLFEQLSKYLYATQLMPFEQEDLDKKRKAILSAQQDDLKK